MFAAIRLTDGFSCRAETDALLLEFPWFQQAESTSAGTVGTDVGGGVIALCDITEGRWNVTEKYLLFVKSCRIQLKVGYSFCEKKP